MASSGRGMTLAKVEGLSIKVIGFNMIGIKCNNRCSCCSCGNYLTLRMLRQPLLQMGRPMLLFRAGPVGWLYICAGEPSEASQRWD